MASRKHAGGRPRTLPLSEIGQRIDSLAKRRRITRDQIADAAGLSGPTMHNICTGKVRDPKFSTLARIAAALNVSVTRLMPSLEVSRSA